MIEFTGGMLTHQQAPDAQHPACSYNGSRGARVGGKRGTYVGVNRVKSARELHDGEEVTLGTVVLLRLTYSPALNGIFRRVAFEAAGRDPATHISNTPYLADRLRSEHAFARRHQQPLSIIFSRVDRVVNLRDPHAVGAVMRAVAAVNRESIRTEGALASVGEDELVGLIRADAKGAESMMKRVRSRLRRECQLPIPGAPPVTMAVVIMPLESSIIRPPETIIMAARERARLAIGGQMDCTVQLPPVESDRAPRRDIS